jgi:hypothetical protein
MKKKCSRNANMVKVLQYWQWGAMSTIAMYKKNVLIDCYDQYDLEVL